jgi:hypothetical protein
MYVLVVGALGPTTFRGWMMVLFGLSIDLRGAFETYAHREPLTSYGT